MRRSPERGASSTLGFLHGSRRRGGRRSPDGSSRLLADQTNPIRIQLIAQAAPAPRDEALHPASPSRGTRRADWANSRMMTNTRNGAMSARLTYPQHAEKAPPPGGTPALHLRLTPAYGPNLREPGCPRHAPDTRDAAPASPAAPPLRRQTALDSLPTRRNMRSIAPS